MNIIDVNPWWKTNKIEEEWKQLPKREIFEEIKSYLNERQIIVITGLRRVGKTVLMHHLIDTLLQTKKKEHILYYDFDLGDESLEEIFQKYKEITGTDYKKEKIVVVLDEIQKHKNWENEIKVWYDFTQIKFIISGSASLFIEKKTKESLAGRTASFHVAPLSFREYLLLTKQTVAKDKTELYKEEIRKALSHYMKIGGFPELLYTEEETKIKKYIKELIIDRIVYIDIPKVFDIQEPELLTKILSIISASPGMLTDYGGLANDLQRNRKTITNYIMYLEKSFLIKKMYNYSKNLLTSEKKLKKIYPTSSGLCFLHNAELGLCVETILLMNKDFTFFWRKGEKEVDFIETKNNTIIPIEMKFVQRIPKEKEIKGMILFLEKWKKEKGIVITDDKEGSEKMNGKTIEYIPLWKYLLFEEK